MQATTHKGPSIGALAIVFVTLFIVSVLITNILTHGATYPRPYGAAETAQDYYLHFATVIRISSFLQFGAAVPLGLFTASVTSRLKFLGVTASGVHIALFGGISASLFLALSGLSGWVLSQPGIANEIGAMRVVQLFSFATGGIAHVVMLGLLLAGVSVPALFLNLMPRWLCWMGLIIAAIAVLSTLSLLAPPISILLPLARFASFIWFIGTGFTMAKNKMSNRPVAS